MELVHREESFDDSKLSEAGGLSATSRRSAAYHRSCATDLQLELLSQIGIATQRSPTSTEQQRHWSFGLEPLLNEVKQKGIFWLSFLGRLLAPLFPDADFVLFRDHIPKSPSPATVITLSHQSNSVRVRLPYIPLELCAGQASVHPSGTLNGGTCRPRGASGFQGAIFLPGLEQNHRSRAFASHQHTMQYVKIPWVFVSNCTRRPSA